MKLTPSSTARRSVALAWSASGGSPQMPSPVTRIAPNPIRATTRSPPISMVPAAAALTGIVINCLLIRVRTQSGSRDSDRFARPWAAGIALWAWPLCLHIAPARARTRTRPDALRRPRGSELLGDVLCRQAERMPDRIGVDAEMLAWLDLELGRAGGQHPRLGAVQVIDVEVQVHLHG